MAQIYVTDFKEKRVVKSYDSQIELQNRLNNVTCSLCQEFMIKAVFEQKEGLIDLMVLVRMGNVTSKHL